MRAEERFYESGRLIWLDSLRQDMVQALRGLHRSPSFATLAIGTLAVGIGACTAIFSVVDPLLFRSLPYPQADRLVSVGITGPIDNNEFMIGRTYFAWKQRRTPFESLTSMLPAGQCDLGSQNPVRIHCVSVESNFLGTLGIKPLIGQDISVRDDLPNAPVVALISYGLWRSRFGGNPHVVGKTLQLDDRAVRIAGVLPQTFEMPQLGEADVLMPEQLDQTAQLRAETGVFLRCFARLKSGVSIAAAREDMQPLYQLAVQDAPAVLRTEIHFALRSLRDRQIRDVRLASWMLLGVVSALLLISCSNVANLLLTRASARRREFAMRVALGASRGRVLQSTLTESLQLAVFGGAGGCVLAWLIVRTLRAVSPDAMTRLGQATVEGRAILFTLVVSLIAAVIFGLVPGWERPRAESLMGWHSVGARRGTVRHLLVMFQIAMSLVLITGAALLSRSLGKLESQPLGMEPERVTTASLVLSSSRYRQPAAQDVFYRQLESHLSRLPGVSAFALSDSLPPGGGMHGRPFSDLRIAGHPPLPQGGGMVGFRDTSPGYFQALHIPILSGRAFGEGDRSASQPPLILNASLARKLFPRENAVGQEVALSDGPNGQPLWSQVIGVAADVKNDGLAAPPGPEYYRLRTWNSNQLGRSVSAIFRSTLAPDLLAAWIRREVAALDPALPVKIESLQERVNGLTGRPRFITVLVGLFAAFGLLLAGVGLYGTMSFLVGQQTREIGVRMAIGATPHDIAGLILQFAARSTSAGALLGLLGSLILSRLLRGLLFGVSPRDPVSFAIATAILLAIAFGAALVPSVRAARVDPSVSLRHD